MSRQTIAELAALYDAIKSECCPTKGRDLFRTLVPSMNWAAFEPALEGDITTAEAFRVATLSGSSLQVAQTPDGWDVLLWRPSGIGYEREIDPIEATARTLAAIAANIHRLRIEARDNDTRTE